MPPAKRIAVLAAVGAGVALLALGAWLFSRGHAASGGLLASGVLLTAALALHALLPGWDLTGRTLRRGDPARRDAALTFDDGPGPDTPAVLDALDAAGVKATFFFLGARAEERPDLVREAARRGHLVALHGQSHRKLLFVRPATVAREIDRCAEAIRRAGVEPAPFFRAPHGFKGPWLPSALARRGLTLVGWTRGVWDTERPGPEAIAERACAGMRPGEILLLHDGCGTPGIDPRRDQTAAAVPEIARRWAAAGFRLVTVDALVPARGLDLKRAARWATLGALALLAAWAARRLDLRAVGDSLRRADLPLLAAAAAVNVAAHALQALRWRALIRPAAGDTRFRDVFAALVSAYAVGMVMPARAADVARTHLLSRRSGRSMAALAGTVALDHLMGGVTLVALLALAPLFMQLPPWAVQAGWTSLAIGAAAFAALFLLRPRRRAERERTGVWKLVHRLRAGLAATGEPRALATSGVHALAAWGVEIAIGVLTLAAFGLPAAAGTSFLLALATTVAAAAAVSPGNAGPFELAVVLALSGLGVDHEPALAFALGYHLVHVLPVVLVGGAILLASGHKEGVAREVP